MSDPLRDLHDEITALRSVVDLSDARVAARIDSIESKVARLEEEHRTFVGRSWAMVVLVLTAAAGGVVTVLTRIT